MYHHTAQVVFGRMSDADSTRRRGTSPGAPFGSPYSQNLINGVLELAEFEQLTIFSTQLRTPPAHANKSARPVEEGRSVRSSGTWTGVDIDALAPSARADSVAPETRSP